ncbi:MAG TPA: PAS domain-containing protein [Bacteroidota bacterium]
MNSVEWIREFPAAITVCDADGSILAMNEKSAATFAEEGGEKLVGKNLLDCHGEPSRTKVLNLLKGQSPNVYTIEKGGVRKMIYQSPWYKNGKFAGFVELSLPIPAEMPHFVRDKPSADE